MEDVVEGGGTPRVMTTQRIADLVNCSAGTILAYIDRTEFSHLERVKMGRKRFFKGITEKDIEVLAGLINARKKKIGKPDYCPKHKHVI